jgi:predicted PurR-regulated permease PerM
MNSPLTAALVKKSIEVAVYLALIFGLLAWCYQIFSPFISLVVWGTIIAVSVYTPFVKLCAALGGRKKIALTIIMVIGLAIIVIPSWLFADSLYTSVSEFNRSAIAGKFSIPPPSDSVKDWPVVGERLYTSWSLASANLETWLSNNSDFFKDIAKRAAKGVAGLGVSVLQFIAAIIVAGLFLSNADAARVAAERFCRRLVGDHGDDLLDTSVATIRSVTVGVLGVAIFQGILTGAGMIVVGVPGAAIWALAVVLLAIAQLPALIVLLPVIIYVFSVESATVASIFAIWSVVVGMSNAVLQPVMMGKGVDTPMLVVLIGAVGGMLFSGIVGLFVGAIVFTLGYKMLLLWLSMADADADATQVDVAE